MEAEGERGREEVLVTEAQLREARKMTARVRTTRITE